MELWKYRARLHVYLMASRSMSQFEQAEQGRILQQMAQLIDQGTFRSMLTQQWDGGLDDIDKAEQKQSKGGVQGKQAVWIKQ
jgi:NADPH:quinone reductase-like Zn-dependent oxidoreductase